MFLLNIIVFVLVLGVIILIHELGHFYFAKKAGILCHEFAIGMGPAIYQKRKGETIYSIRSIPIGGYVSMAGESISDALIKKEQVIGVKLNSQGHVQHIIMNSELSSDYVGIVKDFDLYGKDFNPLFIDLDVQGELKRFIVIRDATYRFSEQKEMWITPQEKSFESKTLWQRFLVIFAGPLMNFILALFLFLIVGFFAVKPNLDSNELGGVVENSTADAIGLETGDQITSINGTPINAWTDVSAVMGDLDSVYVSLSYARDGQIYQVDDVSISVVIQMAGITNITEDRTIYDDTPMIGQTFGRASSEGGLEPGDLIISFENALGVVTPVSNWDEIVTYFRLNDAGTIIVRYERDGENGTATYDLISANALNKLGYQPMVFQLGIQATASFDLGYTLLYPFRAFYSNMMQVFQTIGLLFNPSENLGIGDLSGPVGIFSLVSSTTSQGLVALIGFTAFLSINIGLLNLLPIPALDGGRLVFLGIEAITRKPLNRRLENTINNVMFFLLLGLFVFVTYNDILRLIRG